MNEPKPQSPRGRGTSFNPSNRFDRLAYSPDPDEPPARVATELFDDHSRSILVENDSPDVGHEVSLNPYRGCAHGCSYCYARPMHEFLGLSAGLDFETKLFVKRNAAELLAETLAKPGYVPRAVLVSSATDAYQPIEKTLRITRACLEVFAESLHPVDVVTKNALVERDADLLAQLARHGAASATLTITTLDAGLQRALEPQASTPEARLRAIRTLAAAGVPVTVNIAPVIPGLTDHELPAILEAAREAGATRAFWILLRLPHALKEIFESWLDEHAPTRKSRVLNSLREMHGGKLYDPKFGKRGRGEGAKAEQIAQLYKVTCARLGYGHGRGELNCAAFRPPRRGQLSLF